MRFAIAAIMLALGGCASVDPAPAISEVQATVGQRLGTPVQWDRGTSEDTAVREAVGKLLERPLTVDSAVQIALLNNRRLQADYEELGIAQADLVQSGLLTNPSFSAEILIGNNAVSPTFSVVQDFVSILTLTARRTGASSVFARAKYDLGNKILEIAASTRRAYYTVLADQQAVELLRQVMMATEAAAELSERQARAGNASRREQSLQQAQYAQAALQLSRAEAQVSGDREALNRLLGLFGDQVAWNLPDRLPDVPVGKPELAGLESAAIENRLDLAGAREDLQTATLAADLGRQLRFLSVLGLGVTIERLPENGKWLKGPRVELALPIFDQGQARIGALDAQRRRTERAYAALAVDRRSPRTQRPSIRPRSSRCTS
jgi:cobalt-zinc-cadmium efflux system outer membrane protein